MGLMEDPTSGAKLVLTPHPITLDGQQYLAANLEPGEKLGGFLARVVPDWSGDCWEVRINGVVVPHEIMDRVRPKENALIEVRGVVKKQVLAIVAIAVLAYFTMGAGLAAYGAAVGVTSAVGLAVLGAVTFAVGSALINKVLMPKPGGSSAATQSDPVYSIGSARNAPRPYDPLPILFGTTRITPDVASLPYSWNEGKEQIMGEVFTPGINVHSIEALYNGDTLLSSYEGVTVYTNGLPGNADQDIPLYSNADTIAGGELNENTTWVERSTPLDAVRIQINLEYLLGDSTNKGKPYPNQETVEVEYRETGGTTWLALVSRRFVNNNMDTQRATLSADVARGQYDVRVRRLGQSNPEAGHNARAQFQWVTMTAVQADDTDYTGIPRIGIRIKATGQLNGALDEIRCVAHSMPAPVWSGTSWVTEQTSNPGAHLLAYARGMYDVNGRLLAGIGLPDEQIDIPALQAFMVHCAANNYTYDAYIKDIRNHTEMCDAIALAGLGQLSWASGRFGVVWADSAQPLTGVVNMATIKKGSFQTEYTLANASDGIEYTYVDPTTWQPVTLRVEAPGITTMQNPARVSGEGVTSEAHAAKLARYHLAQHLYQYKDISFSTDLEHLTYRRLSLLALSHDMTQWGYGGRLRAAVDEAGAVTVQLDEPVPSAATPYIGLRIPGEGIYRVFSVEPFVGESDTLNLVGAWPVDAALPGDTDDNPAHDTIWIYDIKATPGYRVRVVQIEPESDLRGARVAVVPESPEFWTYVNTGAYTPPAGQSLLPSRPAASNLQISESQIVQGDTVFTELQATFDISGTMAYATVHVAQQLDGEWGDLVQVAETRTTQARFRVPAAGAYRIVVRPYSTDGIVGGVATVDYATVGADIPPPAFDSFNVQALPGGIRKYTWAYDANTLQAPDFAGAEVRYIAGTDPAPVWADMTPVGDDGFHTAAFEAVVPVAGTWTFAARARNTSGDLSAANVITLTLSDNLGEVLGGVTQAQIDAQAAIDQEIADRLAADLATAAAAAADATAKADAARLAAIAHADVIGAQVADIIGADDWAVDVDYPEGDLVVYGTGLYRALTDNIGKQPDTNPSDWQYLGQYSSLGEAVAGSIAIGTANTSAIEAEATQLDAVQARMPAGAGTLATSAMVADEATARATADGALSTRTGVVESRMPAGTGELATSASIIDEASARVAADSALSTRTGVVEARMPAGSGELSTAASVTAVDSASVDRDNALGSRIGVVEARMPSGTDTLANEARVVTAETAAATAAAANASSITAVSATVNTLGNPNLIPNPSGASEFAGYSFIASSGSVASVVGELFGRYGSIFRFGPIADATSFDVGLISASPYIPLPGAGGRPFMLGVDIYRHASGGTNGPFVEIRWYNDALVEINAGSRPRVTATATGWGRYTLALTGPAGATRVGLVFRQTSATTGANVYAGWMNAKMESGTVATPFSLEGPFKAQASAVQVLEAGVSSVDGRLSAKHTVSLDVNGYVSGTVSENDGDSSSFSVLASVFRVLAPGAATGMEWQSNYIRVYGSGYQLVMGTGFGVSSNLVQWFGANIGAAACTTANCIESKTTAGATIIRGSNASGSVEITNSQINVRDASNVLRVRMGVW